MPEMATAAHVGGRFCRAPVPIPPRTYRRSFHLSNPRNHVHRNSNDGGEDEREHDAKDRSSALLALYVTGLAVSALCVPMPENPDDGRSVPRRTARRCQRQSRRASATLMRGSPIPDVVEQFPRRQGFVAPPSHATAAPSPGPSQHAARHIIGATLGAVILLVLIGLMRRT